MRILLHGHYSGQPAGRRSYAPGEYDTDAGEMPVALAEYLVKTGHADMLPAIEHRFVTDSDGAVVADAEAVPDKPKGRRK